MYAIVRSGGQQHKVAVGDVIQIDKVPTPVGDNIALPAVLVVDGDKVTADPAKLAKVSVEAEVLGETKGDKVSILKYKNKTGYRKRAGHRQQYSEIKVTNIKTSTRATKKTTSTETTAEKAPAKSAAKKTTAKKSAAKKTTAKKSAAKKTTAKKATAKKATKKAETSED